MSRTTQEGVFILLKVIKRRHEKKRPDGRTELTKLKTIQNFALMSTFKIYVTKLTENYEH